jgi:pyruvate dehydrogenase complex dehydrogenase (E1) component
MTVLERKKGSGGRAVKNGVPGRSHGTRIDWGVAADLRSVTSFTELRRDRLDAERQDRLHPGAAPVARWVEQCLAPTVGPSSP